MLPHLPTDFASSIRTEDATADLLLSVFSVFEGTLMVALYVLYLTYVFYREN